MRKYSTYRGKTFIYALVVRSSLDVKYVGQSRTPIQRAKTHITTNTPAGRWFASRNLTPAVLVLETCKRDYAFLREQFWIDLYRRKGAKLINSAWARNPQPSRTYKIYYAERKDFT